MVIGNGQGRASASGESQVGNLTEARLENQGVWDRGFPKLKMGLAAWYGVSVGPLLGLIDIAAAEADWPARISRMAKSAPAVMAA
jgi:hypothetical protein